MNKTILTLLALWAFSPAQAQLFVDTTYTAQQMIETFFGNSGVVVQNATFTGSQQALAFFEGSQSNIGVNAGLMMSTGRASDAVGPNLSTGGGEALGTNGIDFLSNLAGAPTYDGAMIEMDIVPTTDTLSFRYVFGSEEYQEFVGSTYNDIFTFYVSGPGLPATDSIWIAPDTVINAVGNCIICTDTLLIIPDTFCFYNPVTMTDTCIFWTDTLTVWCYEDPNCTPAFDTLIIPGYWNVSGLSGINIAAIPNTSIPVAINTLNQFQYSQYFIGNEPGISVEYDGFTTPLWAVLPVTPGETYHVKLAIADAGDGIYDSGVFISIESMGGDSLLPVDPEFLLTQQPGGLEATFQNTTLWATEWHWDFGDGATSTDKHPTHTYAQPGEYKVVLTASNWCSQKQYTQTILAGTSGVETLTAAQQVFRISPNPTTDRFTLDLQSSASAQVRLMHTDGRILYNQTLSDGAMIDLTQWGKGVYYCQVLQNGRWYSSKIVRL